MNVHVKLGCADGVSVRFQLRAAQTVEPAINHMMQHLDQPLRVSTLSALAGVSLSQFFLLFKAVTGCTPIDYFIRLRMQRACELLQNRNLSIKETAVLLGYDDPCYFSRLFKAVTGLAPRAYRTMVLRGPRNGEVGARAASGKNNFTRLELFPAASSRACSRPELGRECFTPALVRPFA